MNELIRQLEDLLKRIKSAWDLLQLDDLLNKIQEGEHEMALPDFWNNQEHARQRSKEISDMQNEYTTWDTLRRNVTDTLQIAQLDKEDQDVNLREDLQKQYEKYEKYYTQLEFKLLMNNEYDLKDATIAIHAGTGGTDAQDWAQMLLRMLLRYCEQHNLKTDILEQSLGGEAGIKSCIFNVYGKFSYGYLKSEAGVHRLVRISPFDAEKMRHTSFALVEVMPLLDEHDTQDIELDSNDLRIDTYRASGAGGQHVNKTDSAVRITHEPTGLVVACQSERSQLQNKETAMKMLRSKLYQYKKAEQEEEKKRIRGEYNEAAWGNQIRSYVLHPYKMVKDVRTGYETSDIQKVLDGDLDLFIEAYLRSNVNPN